MNPIDSWYAPNATWRVTTSNISINVVLVRFTGWDRGPGSRYLSYPICTLSFRIKCGLPPVSRVVRFCRHFDFSVPMSTNTFYFRRENTTSRSKSVGSPHLSIPVLGCCRTPNMLQPRLNFSQGCPSLNIGDIWRGFRLVYCLNLSCLVSWVGGSDRKPCKYPSPARSSITF